MADRSLGHGSAYNTLSRDDVGGLRYLYSENNRNMERIEYVGVFFTAASGFVDLALRPGIGKIHLKRMPYNTFTRSFPTVTESFQDRYYDGNGQLRTQELERIVVRPDILFSAAELTERREGINLIYGTLDSRYPVAYRRQIPTGFINLSFENNGITGAGPGIVPPDRRIFFNSVPTVLENHPLFGLFEVGFKWGAFNTLSLLSFPFGNIVKPTVAVGYPVGDFANLTLPTESWTDYSLQSSPDLSVWTTLTNFVGNGTNMTFPVTTTTHTNSRKFYRVIAP